MSLTLKAHLYACYGSFSDKRIKTVEKGGTFIGDSRDHGGIASDGKPFGWFCSIIVAVRSDTEVAVTLSGSIPQASSLDALYAELNALPGDAPFTLRVRPGDVPALRRLAGAIDDIVARGRRYSEASYKYMCPRTAHSLNSLAGYLETYWSGAGPKGEQQEQFL